MKAAAEKTKSEIVCVCIPTRRRPQMLAECLRSVSQLLPPSGADVFAVVVDNDEEQSAKEVFQSWRPPFPAFYENEPQPGLSRARNRGMEKARSEGAANVLFVDDDMRPPPQYLKDLTAEMQAAKADAARGRMIVTVDAAPAETAAEQRGGTVALPSRRASLFSRRDMLAGNGALLGARIFCEWKMRFDEDFMHGWEDGDFFYRASLRGARLWSAANVVFYEHRPPERIPARGFAAEMRRAMEMREGHVALRRHRGGFLRGLFYAFRRGIPLLLQLLLGALAIPLSPKRRAQKTILRAARITGLARGLLTPRIPGKTPPP